MTLFGTSAKYIDAVRKAGLAAARHARPLERAHADLDRLAARAGKFRLRLRRDQAGPASRLDLRRHRHRLLLRARRSRRSRSGAARSRGRASAWRSTSSTRTGRPVRGEKGELVCTRPFPSMPVMFWNDPDGAKYRAAYFERFPGIWAHGDFAEWTRAWRHHHPRPLRRHAQSRRRAHRHGGDLCAGRGHARGAGGARHRPGLGQRRAHRAVRAARGGRRARRRARRRASRQRSAPAPRRATCRRRSSRSPTSRAPSRARSPSSRCATSCTAAR